MKRALAIVLVALVSAMGGLPADAAPKARVSKFCGEFCVQGTYPAATQGAFFVESINAMVHVSNRTITAYSTITQKKKFTLDIPQSGSIRLFEHSPDNSNAVFALDTGDVYHVNFGNETITRVNGAPVERIGALAIDNSGSRVYIGYKPSNSSSVPARIDKYTDYVFDERYTNPGNDQGISVIELDPTQNWLYVGFLGGSPTVVKVDTGDLSGGNVAEDSRNDLWVVSSIVVSPTGSVYAANSSHPASPADNDYVPTIIEFGGSTLNTLDTVELLDDWDGFKLALSDDGERLYAAYFFDDLNSELGPLPNTVAEYDTNELELNRELEFGTHNWNHMTMLDVDPSGRFLLVSSEEEPVQLVSLDDAPMNPAADTSDLGFTRFVGWEYTYLNPKAKFKYFEVKYTPANKNKPKVKRVKVSYQTSIPSIKPGTDVLVRAVYTNKKLNSAWVVADEIL